MIKLFRPYFSHFKTDFDDVKIKVGLNCNLTNYLASQTKTTELASIQFLELPWLAIIMLFLPYLIHFKSDFHGVKSRVGVLN